MSESARAGVDALVDEETYTFAELEEIGGVELAEMARRLADVSTTDESTE